MKKILVLFLVAACFAAADAQAGEIAVTGIVAGSGGSGPAYEITVNNAIVIRDITVIEAGGRRLLKFPEYVSRKKKVYPQVLLTTRRSSEDVRNAVLGNKTGPAPAAATGFKITRYSPFRGKSRMKVIAAVSFNGALEIECKIIDGRNGPWVSWPARKIKESGEWFKQVVITDKRLREAVEEELLARYESMTAESREPPDAEQ